MILIFQIFAIKNSQLRQDLFVGYKNKDSCNQSLNCFQTKGKYWLKDLEWESNNKVKGQICTANWEEDGPSQDCKPISFEFQNDKLQISKMDFLEKI
jgi:hypothetical protein